MTDNYSYEEVLDKIENARRFGNLPGIEVSQIMLKKMEHPLKNIPYVHIAGTNGKGSTCALLTQILMEAGFKVGTFTSPHLVDFEERITVNQKMISKDKVKEYGNRLLAIDFDATPTMFDYCLLMACMYFEEEQCDIAIMETGLGGRLDSTNALGIPEVSIITKIGFDHTAILGNTLSEIAEEKAGIMKPGSFVVLQSQDKEAEEKLLACAKNVEALAKEEKKSFGYTMVTKELLTSMNEYEMKLIGLHQRENAAGAVLAVNELLRKRGFSDDQIEAYVKAGLKKASWGGRMEILSENPFLLVDGAHNGHGVKALRESLEHLYPNEKFHFIMGVMADKDYEEMVKELLPLAEDFLTVTVESARALQADALKEFIEGQGIPAKSAVSLEEALKPWKNNDENENENANKTKTVLLGSLYFVGDVKKYIL